MILPLWPLYALILHFYRKFCYLFWVQGSGFPGSNFGQMMPQSGLAHPAMQNFSVPVPGGNAYPYAGPYGNWGK